MPAPESVTRGARARAREEVRTTILDTAADHLAAGGPAELSLRAVARQLGMASSAIYRYFASRDDLLTALIIRAYDDLGATAEAAVQHSASRPPARRWVDTALTIRRWAIDHRHDYALLYGTPIPGYAAPTDTIDPGTRVSRALTTIVADAARDGQLTPDSTVAVAPATSASFRAVREALALDVDDATMLAVVIAWTQLFGLLTFELFGQTVGLADDDEQLFADAAAEMARRIGLR